MESPKQSRPRYRRPSLSHFSRHFLGKAYTALTGRALVPAAFIKRAAANGLSVEQLHNAIRFARCLTRLPGYLMTISQQQLEKAVYWDELGLKAKAGEHYLESALWGLYAELSLNDSEKCFAVLNEYADSYYRASQSFNNQTKRIEIDCSTTRIQAYFRLPAGEARNIPCVILLNNLFSSKEELHYTENSLLSQGLATLSFDYPHNQAINGQPYSAFDVKELGNAIHLYLSSEPEIDCSRLTLYGIGFGGRFAAYLNIAFPERFKSLVCISTPYDLENDLEELTRAVSQEFLVSKMTAASMLFELAHQTPLNTRINQLRGSLLVVGGGKDKIALPQETQYLFEQSASRDKKLILCPGAGHGLYEMMPSLRHEIAQWIKQRS